MGNIVRRVNHPDSGGEEITTRHEGDHLIVLAHMRLGVYPGIRLEWTIDISETIRGTTLMAFRSTSGFCPDDDPDDLSSHGQMILETTSDGEMEEHLPEGTYYYTFLLRRPGFFGLWENRSKPLRFQEVIPSAKVAIGRVEDRLKLQNLLVDLGLQHIRHEISETEAKLKLRALTARLGHTEKPDSRKLTAIERCDRMIEQQITNARYLEDLKTNPNFNKLSKVHQRHILKTFRDWTDPRETLEP